MVQVRTPLFRFVVVDLSWTSQHVHSELKEYNSGFDLPWTCFSKLTSSPLQVHNTRGVQKVRRLTQLTTRYAHHILSLFNIENCNWNALGPAFLHRSDTVVEELLFLLFQPAICRAIQTRMANTVGNGVVKSRNFGWQPVCELTCYQMRCPGYKCLLFFPELKEFMKRHKIFRRRGRYLHGVWLAGRPSTTILLQRDQSFGEMLDQAHFSCMCLCWKVTKYDVRIS